MEELLNFYVTNGWQLCLIAIGGIAILGIMKYAGLFKALEEETRHWLYLLISIGLTVVGSCLFLIFSGTFNAEAIIPYAISVYMVNQTFYNLFSQFKVNDLFKFIINWIIEKFTKKKE